VLAASLGKWLFILAAPVLMIVTAFCYHSYKPYIEPLVELALVSAIFIVLRVRAARLHGSGLIGLENHVEARPSEIDTLCHDTEFWEQFIEEEGRQNMKAKQARNYRKQSRSELWRQANPWGGYNPYD
jgi:hypothetical protein